jgi:hypothetical protein
MNGHQGRVRERIQKRKDNEVDANNEEAYNYIIRWQVQHILCTFESVSYIGGYSDYLVEMGIIRVFLQILGDPSTPSDMHFPSLLTLASLITDGSELLSTGEGDSEEEEDDHEGLGLPKGKNFVGIQRFAFFFFFEVVIFLCIL